MKNFKILLTVLLLVFLFNVFTFAEPTGILKGRVVDSETGTPIENAKVEIEKLKIAVVTDSEGFYTIAEIRIGFYDVRVYHPMYQTKVTPAVGIPANLITSLIFKLVPRTSRESTGILKGKVTDSETGKPIGNAKVEIEKLDISVGTDSDGFYTIAGIRIGFYDVQVYHPKYYGQTVSGVEVAYNIITPLHFQIERLDIPNVSEKEKAEDEKYRRPIFSKNLFILKDTGDFKYFDSNWYSKRINYIDYLNYPEDLIINFDLPAKSQ
ncbi:carboxypeptidase regulatory-like domain-containing protein, partial [Candidatus Dependentiae bacterium]|nr:carboxypeptidase regulatory-like domain-containing protein [Candidatus Dependentiae bacterium]